VIVIWFLPIILLSVTTAYCVMQVIADFKRGSFERATFGIAAGIGSFPGLNGVRALLRSGYARR
jgi:hypothetical protein